MSRYDARAINCGRGAYSIRISRVKKAIDAAEYSLPSWSWRLMVSTPSWSRSTQGGRAKQKPKRPLSGHPRSRRRRGELGPGASPL